MTPPQIHMLNSTLLALPVAVVLTRRLLLAGHVPVLIGAASVREKPKAIPSRPDTLAERLKNVTGYHHYGINE